MGVKQSEYAKYTTHDTAVYDTMNSIAKELAVRRQNLGNKDHIFT